MYFATDSFGDESPTSTATQLWWSHRIVRSDIWVELRDTPQQNNNNGEQQDTEGTQGRRAVVAFVAKCAIGWSDASSGSRSVESIVERIDVAFEELVAQHANVVEAFQLGALRRSCTFAVRREVVCLVIAHAVWSQFALQSRQSTEPTTTLFSALLTQLILTRWARWAAAMNGLLEDPNATNAEPRSALLFVGVVAQVLGLLPDHAGGKGTVALALAPKDVILELQPILPTLFHEIVAHTASAVTGLVSRATATKDAVTSALEPSPQTSTLDTQSLIAALSQLLSQLTTDDVVVEATIQGNGGDSVAVESVRLVVVQLQRLFEALLSRVLGKPTSGSEETAASTATNESGAVVAAQQQHKDLCQLLQSVQATIAKYQSLLENATPLAAEKEPTAASSSSAPSVVLDVFINAALEDATLAPTSKTLSRMLLQRTVLKATLTDTLSDSSVAAAMKGLLIASGAGSSSASSKSSAVAVSPKDALDSVSPEHMTILIQLLHASPVLWFQAFFAAVTRRSGSTGLTGIATVDDEAGAAFQVGPVCRTSTSTASAVGVTGLESFAHLHFRRQWHGYRVADAFLAKVLQFTPSVDRTDDEVRRQQRILRVLSEAGKIALDFHAQQSGSPVAADHLQCLWWLATCEVQKVVFVSNGVPSPLSLLTSLPVMTTIATRVLLVAPAAPLQPPPPHAAVVAASSPSSSRRRRNKKQQHAPLHAEEAAAAPSTTAANNEEGLDHDGGSDDDGDEAVQQPSLTYIHRSICLDGSTNLFGWFLPLLHSLGVDFHGIKTLEEAHRVVATEAVLDTASALFHKRRAVMYFLQSGELSVAGESYRAPSAEPARHARRFLKSVWSQAASRRQFIDIVAEAAMLISLRAYRVDSVVKNVSHHDIDVATAFFFGVLRLLRRCSAAVSASSAESSDETQLPGDVVLRELKERLATVAVPSSSMAAPKKLQVRRYLQSCLSMATVFVLPAPVEEEEPEDVLPEAEPAVVVSTEDTLSVSVSAKEVTEPHHVQPAGVNETEVVVDTPTIEAALPTNTSDDTQSTEVAESTGITQQTTELNTQPSPSSTENNISVSNEETPSPAIADPSSPSSEEVPQDNVTSIPKEIVLPPLSQAPPPTSAPSATTKAVVQEYRPPSTSSNAWIEWFWSITFNDVASPEEANRVRMAAISSVSKMNISHQVLQQLRANIRDEVAPLKQTVTAAMDQHRAVLASIIDAAVAHHKLGMLRPVLLQWMNEIVLRSSISIPDAHVSVVVLQQFVTLFPTLVPEGTKERTNELPQMITEAIRNVSRGVHSLLTFPQTLRSARCTSYFFTQVMESIVFAWRRASLLKLRKNNNTAAGSQPRKRAIPLAVFDVLITPARKEIDVIKDMFMETLRTMETLLNHGTEFTDAAAHAIKREFVEWLGLYELVATRVGDAERKRREDLRKSNPDLSDDHPILRMRDLKWTFPDDQPKEARAIPMLFDYVGGGGGGGASSSSSRKRDRTPDQDRRGGGDRSNSRNEGNNNNRRRSTSRGRRENDNRRNDRDSQGTSQPKNDNAKRGSNSTISDNNNASTKTPNQSGNQNGNNTSSKNQDKSNSHIDGRSKDNAGPSHRRDDRNNSPSSRKRERSRDGQTTRRDRSGDRDDRNDRRDRDRDYRRRNDNNNNRGNRR